MPKTPGTVWSKQTASRATRIKHASTHTRSTCVQEGLVTSQKGLQGSRNSQRSQRQIYFRPKTHGQHYYARQRTRIQLALLTSKTNFLVLLSKYSRSNVLSFIALTLMAIRITTPAAIVKIASKCRNDVFVFFSLGYISTSCANFFSRLLTIRHSCIVTCWRPV